MKIKTLCSSFVILVGIGKLYSQENNTSTIKDPLSNYGSYQLWADYGVYPGNHGNYSGQFEPANSIRVGLGKQFSIVQVFGFFELKNYKFEQTDALTPPFVYSDKRSDIAFYGMMTMGRMISLGIGIHYTHEDNIIVYDRPYRIISESGARSYYGIYCLVGIGYPIRVSNSISLPIGLYYHIVRSDRVSLYLSDPERTYYGLKLGIIYDGIF